MTLVKLKIKLFIVKIEGHLQLEGVGLTNQNGFSFLDCSFINFDNQFSASF